MLLSLPLKRNKLVMKIQILCLLILFGGLVHAQSYKKIHGSATVVDTHNDILMKVMELGIALDQDLTLKTQSDLARFKQGGVDVQVFSVYCDGDTKNAYKYANTAMDSLDAAKKEITKILGGNFLQVLQANEKHG